VFTSAQLSAQGALLAVMNLAAQRVEDARRAATPKRPDDRVTISVTLKMVKCHGCFWPIRAD